MATLASFSSILTHSSSSSSLYNHYFHSLTRLSPKPVKHLLKTLTLNPLSFTPLHLCHCTAAAAAASTLDDVESTVSEDVPAEAAVYVVDEGRIYVGNLPYTVTEADLSEMFSRVGLIKSAEIKYDKDTEKSRGFGFVTLESGDEAKEAIRMFDGYEIEGRAIKVNIPEAARGGERRIKAKEARILNQSFVETPHKVYAGNLAWGVTTQGLRDAFADKDGFLSAKVIYERERARSRGFGFISFQSAEGAQSAITAMDGVELEGRPLRLNLAIDRSRANATDSETTATETTAIEATTAEQGEVLSAVTS